MEKVSQKINIILFLAALISAGYLFWEYTNYTPFEPDAQSETFVKTEPKVVPIKPVQTQPQTTSTPDTFSKTVLLKVPFTPQAPTANWDLLHNEACEEASVIMASEYFSGNTDQKLEPSFVESEITRLTKRQKENFNHYLSITSEEAAQMAEDQYELKAEIVGGFEEETIKKALREGKLVLWAGDGRLLNNPNFKTPGPKYHMLVIKGYDENGFITNDPGTRNGQGYFYDFQTLLDGNGKYSHLTEEVNLEEKHLIVLSQPVSAGR